jgi:hypothetical protein
VVYHDNKTDLGTDQIAGFTQGGYRVSPVVDGDQGRHRNHAEHTVEVFVVSVPPWDEKQRRGNYECVIGRHNWIGLTTRMFRNIFVIFNFFLPKLEQGSPKSTMKSRIEIHIKE